MGRQGTKLNIILMVCLAMLLVLPGSSALAAKGKLVMGLGWEPSRLDPHVTSSFEGAIVDRAVFDTLIRLTPEGDYYSGLAEKWEMSEDGKTYTFYLRKGVKFHNGVPFTAAAVKYSFDRIVNPATKSEAARTQLGPYESTEVVDDHTVKIHLKSPFSPLLTGLARSVVAIVEPGAAEKWGEQFDDHMVGTGPFIFKERVRKDHILLVKNPDYNWGSSLYKHTGPAQIDEIMIKFIAESAVRVGTLETGETNLINEVPGLDYARLAKDKAFTTFNPSQPGTPLSIALNTSKPPLSDLKVRQALEHAINKQQIVDTLFAGLYPVAYAPLTPTPWATGPEPRSSTALTRKKRPPFWRRPAGRIPTATGWWTRTASPWSCGGRPSSGSG